MIKSNLSPPPPFPATFWDFVPFLCAGVLALVFTALLVLLVEDDASDGKVVIEQLPQLGSTYDQRRIVGLSEKEREWAAHSYSSYHGYSPVQYREKPVTGPAATPHQTGQTAYHQRPVFPKRLLALPPSPTSPTPTQAPPSAPMLSMAKVIMHRHDQATRRARQIRAQRQQLAAQQQSQPHASAPPPRTPLRL